MNALLSLWKSLTPRQLVALALLYSLACAGGAHTFQALGYEPCQLCYYQRYPHYTAIVLGLVVLATRFYPLAWAGALAAATTSGIGFYHTGVERKWWPGPASCSGSGQDITALSPGELLTQLQSEPVVFCDEIPWRMSDAIPWDLLDITMANLNAVGSLVFVFVWIAAARRAG